MNLIKGVIYGIFAILPGLSASALAIYYGDYQNIIKIVYERKIDFKSIIFVMNLVIGVAIGVALTSNIIMIILNGYSNIFNLFVFLINIIIIILYKRKNSISIVSLLIIFLSAVLLYYVVDKSMIQIDNNYILFFLSGIIYSFSNIVPGLSGTTMMINIGFYHQLLLFYKNPILQFLQDKVCWSIFILTTIITSILLIRLFYKCYDKQIFKEIILLLMILSTLFLI